MNRLSRGQTHILEQGSNVGCHQQYSRALRCCQLACHNSLSQVGRGLAPESLQVKSGRKQTNRRRQMCLETGYKAGNLPEKPGLRRLGWSIFFFFSGGRASTSELKVRWRRRRLACCFSRYFLAFPAITKKFPV